MTLLPVTSKVFSRMIIDRIQKGVDRRLRKVQSGFRPGRGVPKQIIILRNILEQANECRAHILSTWKNILLGAQRESFCLNEELWCP